MQQRHRPLLSPAVAVLIALGGATPGCFIPVQVTSPEAEPSVDPPQDVARVERRLRRYQVAADGVEIYATLWDRALLDAHQSPDTAPPSDEVAREEERERWTHTFLERTSFTVAIEVAHRRPAAQDGDDDLTRLDAWSFRLDRGDEHGLTPVAVDLIGIDRHPSASGTPHFRLIAQVHFEGSVHAAVVGHDKPVDMRLRVLPRAKFASLGTLPDRDALGMWAHRRGIALWWRLQTSTNL